MNKIEKSELLIALYAKQEETKEEFKKAQGPMAATLALGRKRAIDAIIQMITDDF